MRFLCLLLFAAILAGCRTSTDGKKHHYLLENRRSMDFLKETFREGHAHDKREMRTDTNFKKFNEKEKDLPVDQHLLIAMVAPRPMLVCSARGDRWADPEGEFLALVGADPVYRLLGADGLAADKMPADNELVKSRLGYHIRPGRHGIGPRDWAVFVEYANAQLN